MKNTVIGILAHVDAGKTTLSESILYLTGKTSKLGRVDKGDAYLDNFELERARGITIFSKQAEFEIKSRKFTLLDTPGHVDFSAETERTLAVLDYAILVINGADGVQQHTKTLWNLLEKYNVPVFLFVNKMDQPVAEKDLIIDEIKEKLSENCIDFTQKQDTDFYEQIALCEENIMNEFLENEKISEKSIKNLIKNRKIYPCFFGSALKLTAIDEFIKSIHMLTMPRIYNDKFSAKVFKITHDESENRLVYLKITGGSLKVRDTIKVNGEDLKVNQIRMYSGNKFKAVNEAFSGDICAVAGFNSINAGDVLGENENTKIKPTLEPVLSYKLILSEKSDPRTMLKVMRKLEEEDPQLKVEWNKELQEIKVQLMGNVQAEILQSIIKERFGVSISFARGEILYRETINDTVEGVGHFEPLRHYSEVHLILEPIERGSGVKFSINCSEDILAKNWQRLVLTHLKEKAHRGVLTGADITDVKITLVSGRAHNKHTEGGDFREATYRAVRHGLRKAESILLEPYYAFRIEIAENLVGRVITDVQRMQGKCEISSSNKGFAVVDGSAPVALMQNYQSELTAYSHGEGRMFCSLKGYFECHNAEEIISKTAYNPEADLENPTGSVFCSHGAGFTVSWDEVEKYMHLESCLKKSQEKESDTTKSYLSDDKWISPEEIDSILQKSVYANKGKKTTWKSNIKREYDFSKVKTHIKNPQAEKYLLVDGYNIIHAWSELKVLSDDDNIEGARMKLLDILSNYRTFWNGKIAVVFDAYRVQGHKEEIVEYHGIHAIYTKEAQTADQFIEKFASDNSKKYNITVATSDGLQQIIIRGAGCFLFSARDLKNEIETVNKIISEEYINQQNGISRVSDAISEEIRRKIGFNN